MGVDEVEQPLPVAQVVPAVVRLEQPVPREVEWRPCRRGLQRRRVVLRLDVRVQHPEKVRRRLAQVPAEQFRPREKRRVPERRLEVFLGDYKVTV